MVEPIAKFVSCLLPILSYWCMELVLYLVIYSFICLLYYLFSWERESVCVCCMNMLYMSTCMIYVFKYRSTMVIFYKPGDLKGSYPISSSITFWFINLRQSLSLYLKLGLWSINPTETPLIVLALQKAYTKIFTLMLRYKFKTLFLPSKHLYSMNHSSRQGFD